MEMRQPTRIKPREEKRRPVSNMELPPDLSVDEATTKYTEAQKKQTYYSIMARLLETALKYSREDPQKALEEKYRSIEFIPANNAYKINGAPALNQGAAAEEYKALEDLLQNTNINPQLLKAIQEKQRKAIADTELFRDVLERAEQNEKKASEAA